MRRQSIEQLHSIAKVTPAAGVGLSRSARLRRWADLLERRAQQALTPLSSVEYYAERERSLLRGDNTPIAAAFADPVLRAEGLNGDTFGDAQRFFSLSATDAHYLVCDCHYQGRMDGRTVAKRIRAMADPNLLQRLWHRLCATP
jgi:hypothetical protein